MPVTPRDGEEGVRTRRQAALDESRDAAAMAEDTRTSPPGQGTSTSMMGTPAAFDMSVFLAVMQDFKEDLQRQADERQRQADERQRQADERQRQADERQRQADERQRQAMEELKEGQRQALDDLKEGQRHATADVKQTIDSKLEGFKAAINNLQDEVDLIKGRTNKQETILEEVHTTIEGVQATISDHEKMIKALQKAKALNTSGTALMTPTGGPKFKLPSFDGTTSWTAFRHQFDVVAKGNGWEDDHALTALTLALRGDALLILENLPTDRRNLDSLLKALEARFGDRHLEHVYRAQLKERIQKSSEGLQQWAAEIERLVRRAYASSTLPVDNTVVQAFVDGIRDHEVRATVRLGHHTTLDAALAHALEVEAVRNDYKSHKVREIVAAVRPRGEPTCYGCGKRGHIRMNCPAQRGSRSVSTATQVDTSEDPLN